ncbi:MAG: 30S ribosomal protein S17 [archaeon]|nr:30S ribosomal protein S17 [archaeon]
MADIQIEKAYQKQDGINGMNQYLLFNTEAPKHKIMKKNKSGTTKKMARRMKATRYFKKVGLGFTTPAEAIQGNYVDKKCPFTGNVSIRGRILKGMVISTKMKRTIIVRRDFLHYIKKYQRYQKRHTNIPAHCSPAFKRISEGDIVTIGQCRPLSKTVRFNVLHVKYNQIFGSAKKQFMLF